MITRSSNEPADTLDELIGDRGLHALAARVGMTHFAAATPIWGESKITARDQTKFFLHIERYVVPRHRAYAMHLLASVVPSQRWGIGEVAPKGWRLYFKGGWGSGTGLVDNQVALLTRGCARVSIAVLTMYDGSHTYGKQTLKGHLSQAADRPTDRPAHSLPLTYQPVRMGADARSPAAQCPVIAARCCRRGTRARAPTARPRPPRPPPRASSRAEATGPACGRSRARARRSRAGSRRAGRCAC